MMCRKRERGGMGRGVCLFELSDELRTREGVLRGRRRARRHSDLRGKIQNMITKRGKIVVGLQQRVEIACVAHILQTNRSNKGDKRMSFKRIIL